MIQSTGIRRKPTCLGLGHKNYHIHGPVKKKVKKTHETMEIVALLNINSYCYLKAPSNDWTGICCPNILDNVLVLTLNTWDDHLCKLAEVILHCFAKAGLKVSATKSSCGKPEITYLGFWITRHGIKPLHAKRWKQYTLLLPLQPVSGYDAL